MSPSAKLQDAVYDLNDAARWGRVDLAVQQVDPVFRDQFMLSRRQWAKSIQVADMELLAVRFEPERTHAMAVVAFNWYQLDHMTLHHTVIEQRWSRRAGHFMLADERVVDGDESLLAQPLPVAPDPMTSDPAQADPTPAEPEWQ